MGEIYVIYLKDKPFTKLDGKIYFESKEKAENYRNNLIRHIGRMLYCESHNPQNIKYINELKGIEWYEMGEQNKQEWFQEADKILSVRTYTIEEVN